nr:hypothetical protein [Tanacetum cinerariifolium]
MTVAGARETVGSQVVQQTGIQCFNCKEFGHFAKECKKQQRVKDYTYHKEKMLLCKQPEKGVSLQAEQADWLEDTDREIDEQELEAHYSYMAKIQEVPIADWGTDTEPLEKTSKNTDPRMTTSTGVIHRTSVSIPQLRSTQMKDKVMSNNNQVKFKKPEVEDHYRISSNSNKTKTIGSMHNLSLVSTGYRKYDETNAFVLDDPTHRARNPVKEILLKLNLPDHRVAAEIGVDTTLGRDQLIRRIHQLDTTYRPFHSEQRIDLYSLNNVFVLPNNTAYSVISIWRTDLQQTDELITPFESPERVFCSKKRLLKTPGLVESSSPELDLFFDIEEHSGEETTEIMTETMKQYMSKTRGNYASEVVRPEINDKTYFELKRKYLKGLCENTFSSSKHEDANEDIEKVLEIVDLFHIPEVTQDQPFKKWHNGTSSKAKSTETSDLAAIQAQLNNLRREIKKVNEKVYAAQVGCELCKGPHYIKDCPLVEEGNTLEKAY